MFKKADAKIHKSSKNGLTMLYFCLAQARKVYVLKWQQITIL